MSFETPYKGFLDEGEYTNNRTGGAHQKHPRGRGPVDADRKTLSGDVAAMSPPTRSSTQKRHSWMIHLSTTTL